MIVKRANMRLKYRYKMVIKTLIKQRLKTEFARTSCQGTNDKYKVKLVIPISKYKIQLTNLLLQSCLKTNKNIITRNNFITIIINI